MHKYDWRAELLGKLLVVLVVLVILNETLNPWLRRSSHEQQELQGP